MKILNKILLKLGLRKKKVENKYNCLVCDSELAKFKHLPFSYFKTFQEHNFVHSIFNFETLNVINYRCPKCGAADRDRLIYLFLSTLNLKDNRLLHVAPSKSLSEQIKLKLNFNEISMDLFMEDVDIKHDLLNPIPESLGKFDLIICSHVLEHVIDDKLVVNNLCSALKDNGIAIFLAPIVLNLESTLEGSDYSEFNRIKYFAQKDHLRIYSQKGFEDTLKSSGLSLHVFDLHKFSKHDLDRYGFTATSKLYYLKK